jgi:hypothetical protein
MSSTNLKEQPAEIAGTQRPPAPVAQDVARLIIQRIMKDKILLGLVIVGVLLIFVGVVGSGDDPAKPSQPASQPLAAEAAKPMAAPQAAAPTAPVAAVDPKLASEFVTWWISKSMDYTAATAKPHHVEATSWMTPRAAQAFLGCFWTPAIEQEIMTGHVRAFFQPVTVQAAAINPDGSVVVSLAGTLAIQTANTAPMTQQITCDFLVRQEKEGLRICDLYNHSAPPTQAAPTSPY